MFTFVVILVASIFIRVFGYDPDKDWQFWVIIMVMCLGVVDNSINAVANQ